MHVHNKSFWCLYVVCTICGTYIVLKIKAYAGSALEVDLAPSRWGFARIENDSSHQASKCEISREMFLPFLASFDARFMRDLSLYRGDEFSIAGICVSEISIYHKNCCKVPT